MPAEDDALHQKSTYNEETAHNRMESMTHKPTDDNDENTQEEQHDKTYQYDQQKKNQDIHQNGHEGQRPR